MRNKFGLVISGIALVGVSGCSKVPNAVNPISWYRDVTGLSKNDDLGKGENEQNLAEGSNQPYPNLGTVPAPPDTQFSGIDRDKLVKSLVADRNNAQYSADNLRAGDIASTVPPPVPPTRNSPGSSNLSASSSATISSAPDEPPPGPPSPPAVTSSAPPPPAASSPPPAAAPSSAPPAASSPQPEPARASTPSATSSSSIPPAASTPSSSADSTLFGSNSQQRKPPPRGSEAPPAESSLQSPHDCQSAARREHDAGTATTQRDVLTGSRMPRRHLPRHAHQHSVLPVARQSSRQPRLGMHRRRRRLTAQAFPIASLMSALLLARPLSRTRCAARSRRS